MDKLESDMDLDSSDIEREIQQRRKERENLTTFTYPLTATSVLVPALNEEGYTLPERNLTFSDNENETKALLYRLVVAAYNYAFFNEFAAKTAKESFSKAVTPFISWLNKIKIDNPYLILKDYEAHSFDRRNNHGGYSELKRLKALFGYAIDFNEAFRQSLTQAEFELLLELRKTKISPNLNKKQISLSSYFGALDWL